jgi:hypothetical protein
LTPRESRLALLLEWVAGVGDVLVGVGVGAERLDEDVERRGVDVRGVLDGEELGAELRDEVAVGVAENELVRAVRARRCVCRRAGG